MRGFGCGSVVEYVQGPEFNPQYWATAQGMWGGGGGRCWLLTFGNCVSYSEPTINYLCFQMSHIEKSSSHIKYVFEGNVLAGCGGHRGLEGWRPAWAT